MANLQLSLKTKWFEMTKSGIKTEDYREINAFWGSRLLLHRGEKQKQSFWQMCYFDMFDNEVFKEWFECEIIHKITAKKFTTNTMTLGYPKSGDTERIIKFEHKGIEIRTGNPDWGAEHGKLYFVIKHGKLIK